MQRDASQTTVVLLRDGENLLDLWQLFGVGIVDLLWVKLLHLLLGDEAALVTVPLLGEVLSAIISDLLLIASSLLF